MSANDDIDQVRHLWSSAHVIGQALPGLARFYMCRVRDIALLSGFNLQEQMRTRLCFHCGAFLIPGQTCSVRLARTMRKRRRRHKDSGRALNSLIYTCLDCQHHSRLIGSDRALIQDQTDKIHAETKVISDKRSVLRQQAQSSRVDPIAKKPMAGKATNPVNSLFFKFQCDGATDAVRDKALRVSPSIRMPAAAVPSPQPTPEVTPKATPVTSPTSRQISMYELLQKFQQQSKK